MGHFSYLGDASSAPTPTSGPARLRATSTACTRTKTVIGENAFIGSDSMLVAPVTIGAGAKTGAGSVVTHDVPDGAVAYGVPARVKDEDVST